MGAANPAIEDILQRATQRARENHLGYRGALTPDEAWPLLQRESGARLLDIRSKEEWTPDGRLPGAPQYTRHNLRRRAARGAAANSGVCQCATG
jgi:hypothetical protein